MMKAVIFRASFGFVSCFICQFSSNVILIEYMVLITFRPVQTWTWLDTKTLNLDPGLYHQVPDGPWLGPPPRVGGVNLDLLELLRL